MDAHDRRGGTDRRGTNRYPIDIAVEWETDGVRKSGSMSDVSLDGCFVLSSGEVDDGAAVRVFIPLDGGMKVQFSGKVANHVFEIGFGVKFEPLSVAQRELLIQLVRNAEQS